MAACEPRQIINDIDINPDLQHWLATLREAASSSWGSRGGAFSPVLAVSAGGSHRNDDGRSRLGLLIAAGCASLASSSGGVL